MGCCGCVMNSIGDSLKNCFFCTIPKGYTIKRKKENHSGRYRDKICCKPANSNQFYDEKIYEGFLFDSKSSIFKRTTTILTECTEQQHIDWLPNVWQPALGTVHYQYQLPPLHRVFSYCGISNSNSFSCHFPT